MKKISYSVIVPAYNEEAAIGGVLEAIKDLPGCSEIIVIDDGSSDRTAEIAQSYHARVIKHSINKGYGAALKTGIKASQSEYIAFFDSDGQHRKEDLLNIVREMENYDMVVGARTRESSQSLLRMPGKFVLRCFVNFLTQTKIPDFNSGLRSFRVSEIKKYLNIMPDGWSFSTTSTIAMHRMKHAVKYIPVQMDDRKGRKSTIKILKDGLATIMLIINLTVLFRPFDVFAPPAVICILGSILYFIFYSAFYRVHVTASMVMFFLVGVILFFMGILCEQISAIRREINQKNCDRDGE